MLLSRALHWVWVSIDGSGQEAEAAVGYDKKKMQIVYKVVTSAPIARLYSLDQFACFSILYGMEISTHPSYHLFHMSVIMNELIRHFL